MKKFVITEEEKKEILSKYNRTIQNEQLAGRGDTRTNNMRKKYPEGIEIPTEIKSTGGNTFLNGIDKINESNPKIIEIIDTLKKALEASTGDVKITVNGGASKVGSSSGYDNEALAKRRRDNLINFIKKKIQDSRLKITPGTTEVGDATVKNSPESNEEQFVSVNITTSGKMNVPLDLGFQDNTSVYKPEIFKNKEKEKIPIIYGEEIRLCLRIPKNKKQSFLKMLNTWAKENGLEGQIPWRETKIE
jgi:hypothetical protein